MLIPNELLDLLKNSTNVAIFSHVRPDGDCLGSASALKSTLEKLGKNVDLYCDCILSENYSFIKHLDVLNKPNCLEYDLAVAVDCSDLARLGEYSDIFQKVKNTIKIDHHKTYADFANVNFVEHVGSTCEILYFVIKELGVEIDSDIACALYAGVSSDTGCFMHNNTTSNAHKIAGELLEVGFDLDKANYNLFKRRTVGQINLLKTALNNMRFIANNRVAISYLTLRDFKVNNTRNTETYGIVNTLVDIDSVDIGILISEDKPNLYTCSFRSKGNVDVSLICQEFGGGGHLNASGCNIFGGYNNVIDKIEKVINSYYARIS